MADDPKPNAFDRVFEQSLTRDDREMLYCFRIAGGVDPTTGEPISSEGGDDAQAVLGNR
jgi:hypothetical protein